MPPPGPTQGDQVRSLLLNLYPRSRMAVPAPLGGFDRDINTSEEIVSYATAFDTMLGAGYDFGTDRAAVVELLRSVTDELYRNFSQPATAGNVALLNQNNHRSKSGAAMAIAAVVLADEVPAAADWWDYGVREVDDVLGHMLVTGDGAYGEGPYYYRYTMQNLLPLMAVWERHLGSASWDADGVVVRAPLHDPRFARSHRWMLDMALPDGTMAAIDDGNPGRSYYWGAIPAALGEPAAGYHRWARTPQPLETDGSIDLSAETIVAYDDTVTPAPPTGARRSSTSRAATPSSGRTGRRTATVAIALGEHDTAAQFGRDRTGTGRAPQSHEHADPGSFLLNAFGQRLALDPGYLTFPTRTQVNKPEHHNTLLVDGAGPADYLQASLQWLTDPQGRPPAEGQATISATLDTSSLDAATVSTRYRGTELDRRFWFVDDRYLLVADDVDSPSGDHALTWMLHGNGGGTSGGTFTATPDGGRWEIGGARLDSAVAVAGTDPTLGTSSLDPRGPLRPGPHPHRPRGHHPPVRPCRPPGALPERLGARPRPRCARSTCLARQRWRSSIPRPADRPGWPGGGTWPTWPWDGRRPTARCCWSTRTPMAGSATSPPRAPASSATTVSRCSRRRATAPARCARPPTGPTWWSPVPPDLPSCGVSRSPPPPSTAPAGCGSAPMARCASSSATTPTCSCAPMPATGARRPTPALISVWRPAPRSPSTAPAAATPTATRSPPRGSSCPPPPAAAGRWRAPTPGRRRSPLTGSGRTACDSP